MAIFPGKISFLTSHMHKYIKVVQYYLPLFRLIYNRTGLFSEETPECALLYEIP